MIDGELLLKLRIKKKQLNVTLISIKMDIFVMVK